MLFYTTGDLLQSNADALVNTVNCEGYMGKGIAYQFKLRFPENNVDYIKACKNGQLKPGKLHYFRECGKIIINFPTKNKWREKSKIEYIETGLDELLILISKLNIESIAIPPLGSGNGGLIWTNVKEVIVDKMQPVAQFVDIYIYEPSKSFSSLPVQEPKLSASALVLMEIKHQLHQFNKFRLQKAAYFVNVFSHKKYFGFSAYKYGPYDHSIDVISQKIREFQKYHKTQTTEEAKIILYNKIVSESVNNTINDLFIPIQKACDFVNAIKSDHELECLSTICFLIEQTGSMTPEDIIIGFKNWSEEKSKCFSEQEILSGIHKLYVAGVIEKSLIGYHLVA